MGTIISKAGNLGSDLAFLSAALIISNAQHLVNQYLSKKILNL